MLLLSTYSTVAASLDSRHATCSELIMLTRCVTPDKCTNIFTCMLVSELIGTFKQIFNEFLITNLQN